MTAERLLGVAPSSVPGGGPPAGALQHVVVMGVSGSGKSTIARALATRLGWPMGEADDLHPPANIAKMAAGISLDEDDRRPWLARLAAWTTARHGAGESTVVTCSALTRRSRDVLRDAAPGTAFLHLVAAAPVLAARMAQREHFMPATLLASQLTTLEPLGSDERGTVIDSAMDVEDAVDAAIRELGLPTPG